MLSISASCSDGVCERSILADQGLACSIGELLVDSQDDRPGTAGLPGVSFCPIAWKMLLPATREI